MTGGLLLASVGRPATVYGPRGVRDRASWTCLARLLGVHGQWEAVEWFSLPAGARVGPRRRARTEELWFILAGAAQLRLDGRSHSVERGWLGLLQAGGEHVVRNVGTISVEWLVIELLDPVATAALGREATVRAEGKKMDDVVVNLSELGEFDPRTVFDGPLDSVRLRRLSPGSALGLVSSEREHTVFVLGGSGTCITENLRVPVREGTSITLPLNGALRLEADDAGLELFHATLLVRGVSR